MAIFPVLIFAFAAVPLESMPLLLGTLLLGIGHLPISYADYLRTK